MTVNIRGKEYATVAERVAAFRADHPDWSITTRIHEQTDERVTVLAEIANEAGFTLATGHAEEYRGASSINRTSAVENCETSAVGRALAFLGYAGDASLASADELRDKHPAPRVDRFEAARQECWRLIKPRFANESEANKWLLDQSEGAYTTKHIDTEPILVLRILREAP